jgi:hypothetical protein
MIKHEIKIPFLNGEELRKVIEQSYFDEDNQGKLKGRKNYIEISDDVNQAIFKGLHNITVKLTNEELIDGSIRFVVDENESSIRLYPISIYAIKENEKYTFY